MNIAFVLQDLSGGGAERVIITLSQQLVRRGHKVIIAVLRDGGEFKSLVPSTVPIECLGDIPARRIGGPLIQLCRRRRIDIVCSTLKHVSIMVECIRTIAMTKRPLHVIRVANTYSRELRNQTFLARSLLSSALRWAHRRANATIAVSNGVAQDLRQEFHAPRLATIANPFYTDDLDGLATRPTGIDRLDRKVGFNVVAAGRLTEQKGFDVLISAFATGLYDRDACLYVLGVGPLLDDLRKLAESLHVSERVHFIGFVDNPYPFLARADLFVLSSRFEGLPNVVIQAMCLGTPVLATDCPSGPSEILGGGRYGTLVPVDDVPAMAGALRRHQEKQRTRTATALFRSLYSAEARSSDYERTFIAALRGGRRRR
jgi:glycosyltransferase involved in cell wall biosynthesis